MSKGTLIILIGALTTAISTFLNWYRFDFLGTTVSVNPWKDHVGMGNTLLVLAILAAFFSIASNKRKKGGLKKATLITGLLILLIAFVSYPDDSLVAGIRTEIGYWLTWVGGAITVGGAVIEMKKQS